MARESSPAKGGRARVRGRSGIGRRDLATQAQKAGTPQHPAPPVRTGGSYWLFPPGQLHCSGPVPDPGVKGHVVEVTGMCVCPQYDEQAMVEAVALYNPVSFAFEVTEDFMLYQKGIYSR